MAYLSAPSCVSVTVVLPSGDLSVTGRLAANAGAANSAAMAAIEMCFTNPPLNLSDAQPVDELARPLLHRAGIAVAQAEAMRHAIVEMQLGRHLRFAQRGERLRERGDDTRPVFTAGQQEHRR